MKTLEIIEEYKSWRQENPDTWLNHCRNQENVEDAIIYAALSENHLGKRNSHQYRLKKITLEQFAASLLDVKEEIMKAKSFEELFGIIEFNKPKGVGDLTCYDAALRIGAKINLYPEKIYLHTGTRRGAEKILGKKVNRKFILKSELPDSFQNAAISSAEIEEILCMYKDQFDLNEIRQHQNK